jgi:hypothetical protein
METPVEIEFRHGLGDTIYFAHQIPLYRARGYRVVVSCNPDRTPIFAAAGAEVNQRSGERPSVSWSHPPPFDNAKRIHPAQFNKAGHNLSLPPMPEIGRPDDLWDEFTATKVPIVEQLPPAAWPTVDAFLAPLPRPIVLIHTIGNSFQQAKSLPNAITSELYQRLLDGCPGTLVLLDWDKRVPKLANYRVRHLTDDWIRIGIPELIALLARADLLIGVDSGPFHLAGTIGTPSIGVFLNPGHHPVRYSLPRAHQACLVPTDSHPAINRALATEYNLITESSIDASVIARQAAGSRGQSRSATATKRIFRRTSASMSWRKRRRLARAAARNPKRSSISRAAWI